MFSTGKGGYIAEKAESSSGWLFPVGDEVHELGYTNMFTDMFNCIENKSEPMETFYDGYIVNAIIDAAYQSSKSGKWEPVQIDDWRGSNDADNSPATTSYDDTYYLIKKEILHSGEYKLILKHKMTGEVVVRDIKE
jgi:hypothetical protein